ncbi:MAG: type VII secretion protein EccE [Mycolicibacterium sp.]|uniref:type VII secretion protein EccE n=1 Tax=Mycolicibacterium sp. TaxID=2320850 RepID=UPI003D0FC15A
MRIRTVTVPVPPARTVVAAQIAALVIVGALATAGVTLGWPAIGAVAVGVAALAVIRVHGRNLAGWTLWWLRGRAGIAGHASVAAGVEVRRGDQPYGVLRDEQTATVVVQLCGRPYTPTVLSGPGHALTSNTVPLRVLAGQMVQPGPLVLDGIDIVDKGFRVRRAQGYSQLYSALLSEHPARGTAETYAVIRLNIAASARGLLLRTTVEDATAAVAERLICALQETGCRARPLSLSDLHALVDELAGPLLSGVSTAHNRYLDNDGHCWATYVFSAEDITTANLDDVWTWRVDSAVTTVTLRPADDHRVRVSALVRTQTAQKPTLAPTVDLNTPVGDQARAAMSCVPGGPRLPGLPSLALTDLEGLTMPVGSAGVLIGTVNHQGRRQPVLLPLTDPERDTRILVKTGRMYARQLLLRAAAVGLPVSVYTDTPLRWAGLQELEPFIEVHVSPSATPVLTPHIVVKDRADGAAHITAPTIISMPSDSSYPKGLPPDISFTQVDDHRVAVRTAGGQTKVDIATVPDENPYLFPRGR